eukprot:jgi/Psemu1/283481/fgenesh1_pg.28_\
MNAKTDAEKAEALRLKDAEILARRKKKFDAARFEHIEKTNQVHGQPKPQERRPPETITTAAATTTQTGDTTTTKKKKWGLFKKKTDKKAAAAAATTTTTTTTEPTPTRFVAKPPPPIAAGSVKPTIHSTPHEIAPNWASVDRKHQTARPQTSVGHSSDACYPRPPSAAAIPKHAVPPKKRSGDYKYDPSSLANYNTVGYGAAGRPATTGITGTISAFQANPAKPLTGDPRQTKQPRVQTSTSESMDNHGNITRTITKTITEPNGKVRTETQVIEVPAKR